MHSLAEDLFSIGMAVTDDLNRLAAQDVVYLTKMSILPAGLAPSSSGIAGATEVFRGRLRQALNGDWVFNASAGQNGVVGFMLGTTGQNSWSSSETPATGLQITITFGPGMAGTMNEVIVLTSVIPTDFAD